MKHLGMFNLFLSGADLVVGVSAHSFFALAASALCVLAGVIGTLR